MREIKFRVWNKKEKKMLINGICVGFGINGQYVLGADDRNWEGEIAWIYEKNITNNVSLDNFTIMQYTGIKDKNNKEIYEGDILALKTHYNNIIFGFVVFNNGAFCLSCKKIYYDDELISKLNVEFEIIGNIFENPELLGNKNVE